MSKSQQSFGAVGHHGRNAVRSVTFALRVLVARTQQYADRAGHEAGLHRSDMTAMNHISQAAVLGETLGPGDVAKRMSLSPAAVTALVDRLESVGHLVRYRDGQDRRRVRLDLTDHATLTAMEIFRPMSQALSAALEPYTDEELALILRVLQDLIAAMDDVGQGGPTLAPHEAD